MEISEDSMNDSTILITGSTDGIGKQTALELAGMGKTVLLHGRDPDKGRTVLEQLRDETHNNRLDLFIADLSSQKEIHELAGEVKKKYGRLHVLVNNAGVFLNNRQLTEDGLEMTFAVNHLAPFLLTHLLLDLLKKSTPARIITVSSITHQQAWVDLDNLQGQKSYIGYSAYALSKLGNILFTYELAGRLKETGVTANCLHPGVVNTKLLHAGFGFGGRSLRKGAQTPVYLASSLDVDQVTGKYFVNKNTVSSAPITYDKNLQKRLWRISEKLTGLA